MGLDLPHLHERALASTGMVVGGISADQWTAPTPCTNFDVGTLLNHVVGGNLWVEPLVSGRTIEQVGGRLDGDVLGDDPVGAYEASSAAAAAAFLRPGAMDVPVAVSYGPVPGRVYAGHRLIDVLVHGWDLAKATGQDATLDPELVRACWEVVLPEAEGLRSSGAFGAEVEVDEDADLQTRLLALLGRRA